MQENDTPLGGLFHGLRNYGLCYLPPVILRRQAFVIPQWLSLSRRQHDIAWNKLNGLIPRLSVFPCHHVFLREYAKTNNQGADPAQCHIYVQVV